jgi:proteasome lid subunit RPN8/RPN11
LNGVGTHAVLSLTRAVADGVVAHARDAAPRECCGLLIGRGTAVDELVRAANLEPGPTRYRIDPRDHFAAIRRLRGTGRAILGAYHSHPAGPARPSPGDVRDAQDPGWIHVIVSLAADPPELGAFVIAGADVERLEIRIEDP